MPKLPTGRDTRPHWLSVVVTTSIPSAVLLNNCCPNCEHNRATRWSRRIPLSFIGSQCGSAVAPILTRFAYAVCATGVRAGACTRPLRAHSRVRSDAASPRHAYCPAPSAPRRTPDVDDAKCGAISGIGRLRDYAAAHVSRARLDVGRLPRPPDIPGGAPSARECADLKVPRAFDHSIVVAARRSRESMRACVFSFRSSG